VPSLRELRRIARVLAAALRGHRVQAVRQPDPGRVALETYGFDPEAERGVKRVLVLCARPGHARVGEAERMPHAPEREPGFGAWLRARAEGARVEGVRIVGEDRVLAIRLHGPEEVTELVLQVFGRRSNLYAVDAEGRVPAALRSPAETRPELAVGEPFRAPEGRPPSEGEDRFADVPDAELLRAVERRASERERERGGEDLARRVERALGKEERAAARRLEKLEAELADAKDAARLQREGELLKSVLGSLRAGDREAVARDFETGEPVRIALDPAKAPAENLEALFRRARKAVRTLTKAGAREGEVRDAHARVAALRRDLEALAEGDVAALEAFAAREEVARLLRRYAPAQPAQPPPQRRDTGERSLAGRRVPGRLVPRRYRTSDGLEVWVGRSDEGNDFLTTRLARGNDLFLHVEGTPGSHTVLRTEGRLDPPSESLLEACELAVHFSKARNAGRVNVHAVPIKNVKKPRGAKAGLVTVHGGKTVRLKRMPRRLERVLAARIEDPA